jgi:hypothetical protein
MCARGPEPWTVRYLCPSCLKANGQWGELGVTNDWHLSSPVAGLPERGGNQRNECLESLYHLWAAIEQERRRDGCEATAVGRSLVRCCGAWRFGKPLDQLLHNRESQSDVLLAALNGKALDSLRKYTAPVFMPTYHSMKTIPSSKNAVFWDVTPCGSCKNRHFGRT